MYLYQMHKHHYSLSIEWTGNKGEGTTDFTKYERSHIVSAEGKMNIECSSDPHFRGDRSKYNPEEFLVASISSCHMLWYLHLCADAGVVVTNYSDDATGSMIETKDGGGHFTEVVLHPHVTVADESMVEKANKLHDRAHKLCFIANSVKFEIKCEAECFVNV